MNDMACPTGFTCDTDSGACQCDEDADCAANPTGTVCDTETGLCGCGDASTDCPGPQVFEGTTFVCEAFSS